MINKKFIKHVKGACIAVMLGISVIGASVCTRDMVYAQEIADGEAADTLGDENDTAGAGDETAGTEGGTDDVVDTSAEIKNDETGIPDKYLYNAILRTADSNKDGILTVEEALMCTSLSASDCEIVDLTGINKLQNLKILNLSKNDIMDISALTGMKIETLNLEDNYIEDISAVEGMSLISLNLSNNLISDISPLANVGEAELGNADLSRNRIKDLSPLKDSQFFENILSYMETHPTQKMAYRESYGSCDIIMKINFAGNQISTEHMMMNFPEELLNDVMIDEFETMGHTVEEIQNISAKNVGYYEVVYYWLKLHPVEELSVYAASRVGVFKEWLEIHKNDIAEVSFIDFILVCENDPWCKYTQEELKLKEQYAAIWLAANKETLAQVKVSEVTLTESGVSHWKDIPGLIDAWTEVNGYTTISYVLAKKWGIVEPWLSNQTTEQIVDDLDYQYAIEIGMTDEWLQYHPTIQTMTSGDAALLDRKEEWAAAHTYGEMTETDARKVEVYDEWLTYWQSRVTEDTTTATATLSDINRVIRNLTEDITAVQIQTRGDGLQEIAQDIFTKAAEKNVTIFIDGGDYTWQFSNIPTTADTGLTPKIDVDADVDEIDKVLENANVKEEDTLTVSFSHNGMLPTEAIVSMNVGTKYPEGSKVYFYYFSPYSQKFYHITDRVVQDGKLTVELTHCSDYIFTSEPLTGDALMDTTDVRSFVERAYTLVLGREAEAAGLDSWTESLVAHLSNGVDLGYGFVFSQECVDKNLSNGDFVEMLYNTFMNRPSDDVGKIAWVSQLDAGVEREKILEGFIMSDEFKGICEAYGIEVGEVKNVASFKEALDHYCNQNSDVTAFVARCYTQALGRAYDPVGLEDWCRVILEQENTPTDVAKNFIFSEEFVGKNLSDEEYVKVLYRTFMGREADEAGLAGWLGVLASGEEDREKVLEGFAGSDEFAEILMSFGLN